MAVRVNNFADISLVFTDKPTGSMRERNKRALKLSQVEMFVKTVRVGLSK